MPKSILKDITREALDAYLNAWAERVTDAWIKPRPASSPEHHEKKGFSRAELVELAKTAWLGDDAFVRETPAENLRGQDLSARANITIVEPTVIQGVRRPTANFLGKRYLDVGPRMRGIVEAMLKEFGYTIGFLHHVREEMAKDDGFFLDKETNVPRRFDKGGKRVVTARMFGKLRMNPFVAAAFRAWCGTRIEAPSNKDFSAFLAETGRFEVQPNAARESTRKQK